MRVQSANYTAYKPSTGRPRARSSQTVRSAGRGVPEQASGRSGQPRPHISPGRHPTARGTRPRTRGPRGRLRAAPLSDSLGPWLRWAPAGRAAHRRRGRRAALQPQPAACWFGPHPRPATPGEPGPAGPTWGHRAPDPASPASGLPCLPGLCLSGSLPSPSLSPSALLGPAPTSPLQPGRPAPGNFSSVLGPNSFEPALSTPVRPAAPVAMTVAVADQLPSEPRGWRGGAGREAGWGRGGGGGR